MITMTNAGHHLINGLPTPAAKPDLAAREKTITYQIMRAHEKKKSKDPGALRLGFDALISHDITFVGIVQTARASGLEQFPLPYALTNCHNSLNAVGGTINEDDHAFGLSAARKYGGIYVPTNQAVIHQYAREKLVTGGGMLLGSDSHTRYGSYGCMGVGEGGGELVKQLLGGSYDLPAPQVVLVYLEGKPRNGVGPQDVALSLISRVFPGGAVKNKVLEFTGPGVAHLSADYRVGIDVMTTETTCLSSIWETDEVIEDYYKTIGRPEHYKKLSPGEGAYYDSLVRVDLSKIECMIALPFHPSLAYPIRELQENPHDILEKVQAECNLQLGGKVKLELTKSIRNGKVYAEQGIIVGCAGGMYENIMIAAEILRGGSIGDGYFDFSVYPSSTPVALAITKDGGAATIMQAGGVIKPAFCGPCFGAGDTPAHNTLSIRHATRNFPNREGSKPGGGQVAGVALMDSRSIAATARAGGFITPASDIDYTQPALKYEFDGGVYDKRCYNGFGKPLAEEELRFGPNIKDWPKMPKLEENLLVKLCAVIHDQVTTTDELIPSGETSSYRSNPEGLSEFTLSRRVPEYVARSKAVRALETARTTGGDIGDAGQALAKVGGDAAKTSIGSAIFAIKPGDGSAREQAASCQKVLGGFANICVEYATKRYRSNCINWGIVPFTLPAGSDFSVYNEGSFVYIPGIRDAIMSGQEEIPAKIITPGGVENTTLICEGLTESERITLLEGCLMNYYAAGYSD